MRLPAPTDPESACQRLISKFGRQARVAALEEALAAAKRGDEQTKVMWLRAARLIERRISQADLVGAAVR